MFLAFAATLWAPLRPSSVLLSSRRTLKPHPSRRRRVQMCAPTRDTDPRGFVLPSAGDIVLYPGRWADEDAAGLVEAVRQRAGGSDAPFVVDIVEMKDVGEKLFAATRKRRWFDVADVRVASDAEFVAAQDAYLVSSARSGYAEVPKMDDAAREAADREYAAMKARMLRITAVAGVSGTVVAAAVGGVEVGGAFGLGAASGMLYLLLLQMSVDSLGEGSGVLSTAASRLVGLRFLVPALPFAVLALVSGSGVDGVHDASVLGPRFGMISPQAACAVILGLLTYKIPVLTQTGGEAVDSLAAMPLGTGTTGMLGTVAGMAARAVKGVSTEGFAAETAATSAPLVFIFAGPSGAGKSTLIKGLFKKYPSSFAFSVSHTTREPREWEVDGVDYYFVDPAAFEAMVANNEFVEHATVHGNMYGTCFASISGVLASGKSCILDLDVQGVQALEEYGKKGDSKAWLPRFIWVSPPSMSSLRERLEGRGESLESLEKRLDTATREIAFAATSRIFDLTVITDDRTRSFNELDRFVSREVNDTG